MTESKKPKTGRPTKYTPETAALICKRIATHDVGTATLLDMYDDLPSKTIVYEWRHDYPDFDKMYLEAKDKQAILLAESIDDIAHERHYFTDENGQERLDPAFTNDKRLRIDTRKWIAARLQPTRFGDQKRVEELEGENERVKAELRALRDKLDKANVSEY